MEKETIPHLYERILKHLSRGGNVATCTYTRMTIYKPKHAAMFSCDGKSLYVQAGKRRVCLDFTLIRFSAST